MKKITLLATAMVLVIRNLAAVPLATNPLQTAQNLFEAQKYDAVISHLQGLSIENLAKRYQPQAYLLLDLSYRREGEIDKALGVLQLAVQLFPDDINLLSELADVLHQEELDDRAKPLYERVLSIHPNNSAAHLGLAEIEHTQGLLERSIYHYERCLAEMSKDAAVWRAYAAVLSERLDYSKATTAIKQVLALDPTDARSLESLALFQYRQGRFTEADETIVRAIGASRNKTPFRLERALWLLEKNNLEESFYETQLALQDDPENPLGHWIRAAIALRRGDRAAAAGDLRIASVNPAQFPFIAAVAQSMAKELGVQP